MSIDTRYSCKNLGVLKANANQIEILLVDILEKNSFDFGCEQYKCYQESLPSLYFFSEDKNV